MNPKYCVLALALICAFSIGAKADQEEEFIAALAALNFQEATRIFETHNVDPNYPSIREGSIGWTPFLAATAHQQWALVARMLEMGGDPNATPSQGRHRGRTPFALVIAFRQLPLALRMLELGGDVNVVVQEGPDRGGTPLHVTAHRKIWPLFAQILLTRPEANLQVAPVERPQDTIERLIGVPDAPKWVSTLYRFVRYLDPERQRENPKEVFNPSSQLARKPFLDALFGFIDPAEPITTISGFPPEIRWELAERAIFAQFPELKEVPVALSALVLKLIRRILRNERASFEGIPMTDASVLRAEAADVVAARVLEEVYPIEVRDQRKRATVVKIRKWILELLGRHLAYRVLERETREQLVAILSKVPFGKVTRKWINAELFYFFNQPNVPVAMAEEPPAEQKRLREDAEDEGRGLDKLKIRIRRPTVAITPDVNLRDGLIRDVIRDAPGLDMDQVNARIDEIMGGVQPMDTGDDRAPGNHTSVDDKDSSVLLRAAFHPAVMQRPCS